MKHTRLAHLAVVGKRERAEKVVRERAARIAESLIPTVTEGARYPVEAGEFHGPEGVGVRIELNAWPDHPSLQIWQRPFASPLRDFRSQESVLRHRPIQTFRMRTVVYEMQRDATRVRWYGWMPPEEFPKAEVVTLLHDSLGYLVELDAGTYALMAACRRVGIVDGGFLEVVARLQIVADGLKKDVLAALDKGTERWEFGRRVA
jgi:hypothetical protein